MVDEDRRNRRALPFARGQRRVRDRRQEHVAATRLAANELWIARVVSERAAQFADENFDVLRLNVGVGPDAREDVLMRHQRAGPLDQARQHIGRLARDLDLTGAAPQGCRGLRRIDRTENTSCGHSDGNQEHYSEVLRRSIRPKPIAA